MFYLKKQCIIILGGVIMAFKKIIDKSKDIFKVVKDKTIDVIEKGNLELKKFNNTKDVAFISSPVIAGYETKKAFYEEGCLLFPIDQYEEEIFEINGIIKLEDDDNYYVIKDIKLDPVTKIIENDDKTFEYNCYEVYYKLLEEEFEKDVKDLHLYALTIDQENILNEIRKQINDKTIVVKGKKSTCLDLWVYFVRCIQLHLKNHYTIITFSKLANEFVEDFPVLLINLFS